MLVKNILIFLHNNKGDNNFTLMWQIYLKNKMAKKLLSLFIDGYKICYFMELSKDISWFNL